VSGVERIDNCCVLAAVGQGMVRRKGVAATMMGALAKANVNIKALAQVCEAAFRSSAFGMRFMHCGRAAW
jgi:aspartokinase